MVSAIGRLLQRIDGFRSGDGARDSSVYLENHTAVVDVVGRDAGSAALLVRALDPRTNAPTEVFRVNKDGSVSWVGLPKNVLDYGARGDGTGDDLAAIHAAVDALPAGGGTVYFPAGAYRITGPITNRGKHGVAFVGDGRNATAIQPSSASVDGFSFGTTGAEAGDYLRVADLQVSGGRYALRLNNCLDGTFERLLLSANVSGIYGEGQNERHSVRDVRVSSSTSHGLNLGNTNGGDALVAMDLPLFQKWTVDGLIVDHAAGIGIKLGAGFLVSQMTSGFSQFTNVVCVLNVQGGIELTNCTHVTIQHYTGDSNNAGAEGTLHDVRVVSGTATGLTRVLDAYFTATTGNKPVRYATAPAGTLHLIRCTVAAGNSGTNAPFAFTGGVGAVVDCVVQSATEGVLVSGASIGAVKIDNLLTVAGARVDPAAAPWVRLSDQTLTGAAASVSFPTIPGTFRELVLVYDARTDEAGTTVQTVLLRFNGDAGSNYDWQYARGLGATASAAESLGTTSARIGLAVQGGASASRFAGGHARIGGYASTAQHKHVTGQVAAVSGTGTGTAYAEVTGSHWRSTVAITDIAVIPGAGNFAADSRFTLYGVP